MKEKRYTLQEEQPTPIGWHPANEEEAVARIEAIEAEYERIGVSYSVDEFFNKLNEERTWSNADDFEKELTAQDQKNNMMALTFMLKQKSTIR